MRKRNAVSNAEKNMGEGFQPAETLWRAAHLFCENRGGATHPDSEPTPEEMLGLTIGILRRRKNISRLKLARSIGCSVEELLAFEAGLMPKSLMDKYLPAIGSEIGLDLDSVQSLTRRMKIA